jgi:hypothetical protein
VHATNYFTFEEGLVTNVAALEHIDKVFEIPGPYPHSTVRNSQRGWTVNAGEIKMLFQVSELT